LGGNMFFCVVLKEFNSLTCFWPWDAL